MDVEKALDDCIFKVQLMKKHAQKDLVRVTHLCNNLELIKAAKAEGGTRNGQGQKE